MREGDIFTLRLHSKGKLLATYVDSVTSNVASLAELDNQQIAVGDGQSGVRILDTQLNLLLTLKHPLPYGTVGVLDLRHQKFAGSTVKSIAIWNYDGELLHHWKWDKFGSYNIRLASSEQIVTESGLGFSGWKVDGKRIFSIAQTHENQRFRWQCGVLTDGNLACADHSSVKIVNPDGKVLNAFTKHSGDIACVIPLRSGGFATSSDNGTIKIWEG